MDESVIPQDTDRLQQEGQSFYLRTDSIRALAADKHSIIFCAHIL